MRFLLLYIFLLTILSALSAQTTTYQVNFSGYEVGQTIPVGNGTLDLPSQTAGDAEESLFLTELSGNLGNTAAAGPVATVSVAEAGGFRLLDFDGSFSSGILTAGTVTIAFDFYAAPGADGFSFMRAYDDSFESFADVGFNFYGTAFNVGVLDYDPATGEYLGWLSGDAPLNEFPTGTWHRFQSTINLDNNEHRLSVDGQDIGVVGGISRATGAGYAGFFYNWGSAFAGSASIDNIEVSFDAGSAPLPAAPAGFAALLEPQNTCGGPVLRFPNGDFRTPGLAWDNSTAATMTYAPVYEGISTYRIDVNEAMDESDARLWSAGSIPFLPNHTYEVSALIRTNFPRATWELNVGPTGMSSEGETGLGSRYGGMPAITEGPDGWERWTWEFTPHWLPPYDEFTVFLGVHEYGPGFNDSVSIEIADLAFIECPPQPLDVFTPGEGVTFAGGPGQLPIRIDSVTENESVLSVHSTAATYRFDRATGRLTAEQRIDFERDLVDLIDLPLNELIVTEQTDRHVVLTNDALTIGVLDDGVLVIHPYAAEITTRVVPAAGGDWNRLAEGDLVSQDDFGGFTVNVHTPRGSGRQPRLEPDQIDLPFVGLLPEDLVTTGAAEDGWTATATVSPGERLFVSVFPSRPYDWAQSFDWAWELSFNGVDVDTYYNDPDITKNWILWNFNQRGWAMSFGPRYEVRLDVPLQPHVDAIEAQNENWSAYFSQWFYYSRDPQEWSDEVKRWRDEYGMSAVYIDGMAQDDWLSAYRAARLLRGVVFPGGDIIMHDSYPQSGVHAAAQKPFIYAYATATYMGENAIINEGADWAWPRYGMSQFRRGNSLGVIKGDGWQGFQGVDRYLVSLVWGGRGIPNATGFFSDYLPVLSNLQTLWQTYGEDPFFFDRYYHPEAQILTGLNIGRAGMPITEINDTPNGPTVSLSTWTPGADLRFTTNGNEPTLDDPLYSEPIPLTGVGTLRAKAFRNDLDPSRTAEVAGELAVSVSERAILPDVEVFPNPTTDRIGLRFRADGNTAYSAELLDGFGRRVRHWRWVSSGTGLNYRTFELGQVPAGVYHLRLGNGRAEKSVRVVVRL